ncbi:MAG TPA: hypothetical protein VEB60_01205, partial [Candidatus Paceibacterota bacterium]|nr:hypothetical protein [Candidatus Paceibacterota bacterium]
LSSVDNEQQELSFADIVADSDGWSQAAYEIYRGKSDAEIRSILVVAKKVLELLQGHRPVEEADLKTFNAFLDHVILYRNAHVSFHGCGHRHQVMGQE